MTKKIAIVKLSSLGDIVHALGSVDLASSEYEVYWIVDSSFSGVLKGAKNIKVVELKLRELKKTKSLTCIKETLSTLKQLPVFDVVIDMQGLLKSALISKFLKKKELWGFDKTSCKESVASFFYTHKVNIPYEEHILERNCHLLSQALQKNLTPQNIKLPFLFADIDERENDEIVFAIGSSKEYKKYPRELVVEFVNMVDKNVYLIAYSKDEIEDAEFIVQNSKAKLLPKMSLENLVNKINEFKYLVGVDSGVAYISWALNLKTIILYGPTKPDRFAPQNSNVVSIEAQSMADIKPSDIIKRIL